MSATADSLRTADGRSLAIGELLGRGGEAKVYALVDDPHKAVKIYAKPDVDRARKLAAMIARAPRDPDRRAGHVSIAWPEALVLDAEGRAVGFVMPRIDARRYLPLHQLYHPRSRRKRAPGISWRYLVRIARNLSGTLAALHEAGYVVGDLNESNILVDDRALVTLVDLDSIQVSSGTRVFRCNVGKAEYTPPELQGRSFRETNRRPSSDRFGLAVLVFMLLMEGNHPFSGIYAGEGEPPSLEENIRSRKSPYFGRSRLQPPLAAPSLATLGPELTALIRRALLAPHWRRPDARAFQETLAGLEEELEGCERTATHAYYAALTSCPWCRRAELLGADPFPAGSVLPYGATAQRGAVPLRSEQVIESGNGYGTRPTRQVVNSQAGGATGRSGRLAATGGAGPAVRNGTNAATPSASAPTTSAPLASAPAPSRSDPRANRPPGFRGSWPLFLSRLPFLSLVLIALTSAPALFWRDDLTNLAASAIADGRVQTLTLVVAALLPPCLATLLLYLRARSHLGFARGLFVLERLLRAALGASLLALLASLIAGLVLDRGSVLAGDWLLLPSFWTVAFVLLLRMVGPRRP